MMYNGKCLSSGSDYYRAGLELMGKGGENNIKIFVGALTLFLCGAEKLDRFCIARLKEILNTYKYRRMVDKESMEAISSVLRGERITATYWEMWNKLGSGIFGVMAPTPINHEAAMGFQKRKD